MWTPIGWPSVEALTSSTDQCLVGWSSKVILGGSGEIVVPPAGNIENVRIKSSSKSSRIGWLSRQEKMLSRIIIIDKSQSFLCRYSSIIRSTEPRHPAFYSPDATWLRRYWFRCSPTSDRPSDSFTDGRKVPLIEIDIGFTVYEADLQEDGWLRCVVQEVEACVLFRSSIYEPARLSHRSTDICRQFLLAIVE